MYRLAICEDERPAREALYLLCDEVLDDLSVEHEMTCFSSAEELEAQLLTSQQEFDLLLLDIKMGGKNGLELAKDLRRAESRVSIIFTTSSEEFLREGYSVQPIHYLFKPVTQPALREALKADLRLNHSARTVSLRVGTRVIVLPVADIRYVESFNHGIQVHLRDGKRAFPVSLTEAERRLPAECFCRCHNSFLVNMEHIAQISRAEIVLRDGTLIPVGRKFYAEAQRAFVSYMNL